MTGRHTHTGVETGWDRQMDQGIPSSSSFPNCLPEPGLGHAEAKSMELHSCLPHGNTQANLHYFPNKSAVNWIGSGAARVPSGTLIWNVGLASSTLTCSATTSTPEVCWQKLEHSSDPPSAKGAKSLELWQHLETAWQCVREWASTHWEVNSLQTHRWVMDPVLATTWSFSRRFLWQRTGPYLFKAVWILGFCYLWPKQRTDKAQERSWTKTVENK